MALYEYWEKSWVTLVFYVPFFRPSPNHKKKKASTGNACEI